MYKDIVEHASRQISLLKKMKSFLALLSQVLSTADDIKSNLIEIEKRFAFLSSPDREGVLVQTSVRGLGLLLGILGQDHVELLHPHEVSDHC